MRHACSVSTALAAALGAGLLAVSAPATAAGLATADTEPAYAMAADFGRGTAGTPGSAPAGYVDSWHWGSGSGSSAASDARSVIDWQAGRWAAVPGGLASLQSIDRDAASDDSRLFYFTPRVGGVALEIAGTWRAGAPEAGMFATPAQDSWGASARLSFDAFSFGAFNVGAAFSGATRSTAGRTALTPGGESIRHYSTSVGYGSGAWKLNVGYLRSERAAATPAEGGTDLYLFGASYQVAPGWQIHSELDYADVGSWGGDSTGRTDDITLFVLTNRFDF